MYTYELTEEPVLAKIYYDGVIIDTVGPWESLDAAQMWAEAYVNKSNLGII